MDWDKLKIFHAVAEAGSFTNATINLNLSQSAISRQIQSLEQDLKVQLFERHARGLTLTENGEYVFKTAHEVISKLMPKGTGKGMGLMNSGSPASTTRAPAKAWGTPIDTPQRCFNSQARASRRIPPAAASSMNKVSMMVISFSCYHHRCSRFLGLRKKRYGAF